MTLEAYAAATSCVQGGLLDFHVSGAGSVVVSDAASDVDLLTSTVDSPLWTLPVPLDWPSSLYRATFSPGGCEAWFAVRAAVPSAPILVSVPFATWLAYHRSGVPGESLYYAEQTDRAVRVSFDRPGIGPPPERWEEGLLRWLGPAGYRADYCSNVDLHGGLALLRRYQLLIVNAHDEYWSAEMRDAVEEFIRSGGNVAFLAGNTCLWQVRFSADLREMVCYRDAVRDPMSLVDPRRVTVEWSSAPVERPENAFTGVSYLRGGGCWGEYMDATKTVPYTVRFAAHWAFAGTGLADGDTFGLGAVGYETDAAEVVLVDGVPRATGRDGTPRSFVVLATADLAHWRRYGQGGSATMGFFRLGAGAVFNAATVCWGGLLGDPIVDRITRNVLDRLSVPWDGARWEVIGPCPAVRALVACEGSFFAVSADGFLLCREVCCQNLPWRVLGPAPWVVALAAPREAVAGMPVGVYGLGDGLLRYRDPVLGPSSWTDVCGAPRGVVTGLAIADGTVFAVVDDMLWCLSLASLDVGWRSVGPADGVRGLTGMSGLLFGVSPVGRVVTRGPVVTRAPWEDLGDADGCTLLAGFSGRLAGVAPGGPLRWRDAVPDRFVDVGLSTPG